MTPDRTVKYRPKINRGLTVLGIVLALSGLDPRDASGQGYPLPRSKPAQTVHATPAYPLPRAKPPVTPHTTETAPVEDSKVKAAWTQIIKRLRPREKPFAKTAEATIRNDEIKPSGVWSAEQIAAARNTCRKQLKGLAISYTESKPLGGPAGCGIAAPIKVTSVGGKQPVEIKSAPTINCKLAAATVKWAEKVLQKAAMAEFGEPVVKVRNAASYVCRRRNNKPSGKLSEHALGNALDISSFTLASGKTITVLKGWPTRTAQFSDDDTGTSSPKPASRFLRKVHKGACTVYSTILGPEADVYHVNHFHFDLGRGGRYLVCR